MTEIRLTNSATRRKETLQPLDPSNVRMYVCGPTVYDRAHLGNARPVIVFDVLYRLMRHVYGPNHVTYVRNITDVDDKIIDRARESGVEIDDLTRQTAEWFHQDMAALGALPPTHEPRATQHIADMIAMIETLIARGHAYAADGHVLFSVASDADYGALSGRSVEDMIAGARVEVAPYKRDPMDFVLWKPSTPDQPGWDSPWGRGRPGWHIECSAMARDLLGPAFDIHGGGADLMFPHHENEIAQSHCAGDRFARIWLHNEMLQVEGRKMSKSLGNFFTVHDLLDQGWSGEVIRFVMLSTHYRKPIDWTTEKAREAETTLDHWMRLTKDLTPTDPADFQPASPLIEALSDDLNTHLGLTFIRALQSRPQKLLDNARWFGLLSDSVRSQFAARPNSIFVSGPDNESASLIAEIVRRRGEAKRRKDFSSADLIRQRLKQAGVLVKDTPSGAEWELTPDFDPAKLEALR